MHLANASECFYCLCCLLCAYRFVIEESLENDVEWNNIDLMPLSCGFVFRIPSTESTFLYTYISFHFICRRCVQWATTCIWCFDPESFFNNERYIWHSIRTEWICQKSDKQNAVIHFDIQMVWRLDLKATNHFNALIYLCNWETEVSFTENFLPFTEQFGFGAQFANC